ncbi:MAG TPA: TonB-dependent receptor, partial [Chitinophagaceae bacterium]|nr:TonB-dependent receptor [Chitinophagaceae bacterium]
YSVSNNSNLYGNISQAYRPFLYANITPATQVDQIDPSLKDSRGYDIDAGWRGHYKDVIRYDVSIFYLYYGDRVGLLTQKKNDGTTYLLTTNTGNSISKGIEAYAELSVLRILQQAGTGKQFDVRLFSSLAYDHARYVTGVTNKSGTNVSVAGNQVENAPDWIEKAGLRFQYRAFSTSLQYSYTSTSYNDALNTTGSSNGVTGILPAWHVWDWLFDYRVARIYHVSGGVNNLTNVQYFNRRITMYPGPGILPADGRTFYISFGIKI